MNDVVGLAFAASVLILILGRSFVQRWLMREHAAGRMSGRRAGWLLAAVIAAPLLLVMIWIAIRDPGSVWIIALALIAMAPVSIVPWVAIFRYPNDSAQSKRYPPE